MTSGSPLDASALAAARRALGCVTSFGQQGTSSQGALFLGPVNTTPHAPYNLPQLGDKVTCIPVGSGQFPVTRMAAPPFADRWLAGWLADVWLAGWLAGVAIW